MSYQHHLEAAPRAEAALIPTRRSSAATRGGRAANDRFRLSFHGDIAAIEPDWRRFEQSADGTVFQTFAWQSCWLRHVGGLTAFQPLIAVVRARRRYPHAGTAGDSRQAFSPAELGG